MSKLKLKNIQQTVISTVTQPLRAKNIKVDVQDIVVDGEFRKWVDGYSDRYSIDKDGNVYSHWYKWSKKAILLNHRKDKCGYIKVHLSKNNVGVQKTLHRLLAQAFIPNPKNKRTVNHIDGNKSNNSLSNLEWATYSENSQHAFRVGLNKANPRTHYSEDEKRRLGESRSLFTLNEADDILEMMHNYNISATKMAKIIGCDKSVTLNLSRGVTRYFKQEVTL